MDIRICPICRSLPKDSGIVPGLSIIDVLLNNGPGTGALLLGSLALKSKQE